MKRFFILLSLLAFVAVAPLAMAKTTTINCCIDGKCDKMTKKACKDAKGQVVSSCKKCKPPKR